MTRSSAPDQPRRVFIASLATETNTFAPFPTGWASFEENGIRKDASRGSDSFGSAGLSVFRTKAEEAGWEVVESITAFAQPAGPTVRVVYETLRDDILTDLSDAGPVDLVLLLLHGAMVADGYDDCEGDILQRVRSIAPEAVVGLEIDPHCHLTNAMASNADYITIFKEYPHTDVAECAEALFKLCSRAAIEGVRPFAAMVDTRMVGFYPTFDQPMRGIVEDLRAAETREGVLSASIAHGFPWGDVADVGTRVLVYADTADRAAGEAMALAETLYEKRDVLSPRYPGYMESLDRAAALDGRVVIGDYSDNPGGGAPADSTFFLGEMLKRGLTDAVIGGIFDPMVVRTCFEAGVGATLALRIGGKCGPPSGPPLDVRAEILALRKDHDQDAFGSRDPVGDAALLRCGGTEVVVISFRSQVYGLDLFTGLGVDLDAKRLIVVKSSRHFEAAFGPIADHIWPAVSPGALDLDFAAFPFTKRDPHFHPRLQDPWRDQGRPAPIIFPPKGRR